jgi:hypothetical protein
MVCVGQFDNKKKRPYYNPIYQYSYQHGSLPKDSVVLTYIGNEETDFYNSIKIFRNEKLIFTQYDPTWELIAYPGKLFVEQWNGPEPNYYYILELFGGSSPSKFLIINTKINETKLFGITPASSAEIFGDIDFDGIFEIGGFFDYCQEDSKSKCPDSTLYQIFKVTDNFPVAKELTTYFRNILMRIK